MSKVTPEDVGPAAEGAVARDILPPFPAASRRNAEISEALGPGASMAIQDARVCHELHPLEARTPGHARTCLSSRARTACLQNLRSVMALVRGQLAQELALRDAATWRAQLLNTALMRQNTDNRVPRVRHMAAAALFRQWWQPRAERDLALALKALLHYFAEIDHSRSSCFLTPQSQTSGLR